MRTRPLSEMTVADARAQQQTALRTRAVELDPIHHLAAVIAHLAVIEAGLRSPSSFSSMLTDRRARGDVISQDPNETTFDRADVNWCWSHYLADASGVDPRASPLRFRSFRDLPPALVITAEQDPLHEEGVRYAEESNVGFSSVEATRLDRGAYGPYSEPIAQTRGADLE